MNMDGLVAVVTGGASGLGEASAYALASAGAKVAVLDMELEKAQAVAKAINGMAISCDVSDADCAETALAEVAAKWGACAIAVNCAGIAPALKIVGRDGPCDLAAFSKVIHVNLIGTFNIMRLAAAQMQTREANADGERGLIINTASVAAFEGQIGQAAYSASKGGVVAMTLPAAREFARTGVRVNAIAPGLFATPMLLSMPQKLQDSLTATLPFPARFGRPEEYAKLVLHLADNAVMNGEVVRLDSALRMQPK